MITVKRTSTYRSRALFSILVMSIVNIACWGRTTLQPGQVCTDEMKALLIDEGPNSVTKQLETYHPIDHHGAMHRCGRHSIADGGTFYEEVYEYDTIRAAEREYERQLDVFFRKNEYISKWEEPEFDELPTLEADDYQIACAEFDTGQSLCKMLARYGETVVRLSANRDMTGLSIEDFAQAITDVNFEFIEP